MSDLSLLIQLLSFFSILLLLSSYIHAYISSPLKKIPGPFLAKFSDWWRLWDHFCGTHAETQRALHQKYGKFVRIGPNIVSINDPDLVKTIYSIRGNFVKVSARSEKFAVQCR